jgi:cobalt/nickel transport system permease protein
MIHLPTDGHDADPRVATLTALVVVLTALLSPTWAPPLIILASALALAGCMAIRRRLRLLRYLRLMAFPLAVSGFVLLTFGFTYGTTPAYRVVLPVYEEGLARGFLVFMRVLAATSVVLLLMEAMSLTGILRAMRWMRVPEVLVDLAALVYRYTFVLEEERQKIWGAMVSRLGSARRLGYVRRASNFGVAASNLLVRSFDRSLRTYEAMQSRCYKRGRLYDLPTDPPRPADVLMGLLVSVGSLLLLVRWGVAW